MTEKKWTTEIAAELVGKTIARVEYCSDAEAERNDWYSRPLVIIFTDGSWMMPMRDDEGNDGGALATSFKELPTIPVLDVGFPADESEVAK